MQNLTLFKMLFTLAIVMVGLVYAVIPHLVRYEFLKEKGLQYVPITQESNNDIMIQAGRYRRILDGELLSGEVDTYEHKNGPALWPLLSATMIAPFILITNSVFGGIIITDFIFPLLIFISLFLLLRALTQHGFFALFSAYVLLLFPQLSLLIPPSSLVELKILALQFLPIPIGTLTTALSYLGREAFIPGSLFFILSLYFIYEAAAREMAEKYRIALAGLFYGLLFYLYLYYYVFATIFIGIFFLLLLVSGRKKEALRLFCAGIIGLIVSIPFWISHYHLSHAPNYWELVERASVEIGRGVKWFLWKTYLLFFAMTGAAVWLGRKAGQEMEKKEAGSLWQYFIAALALSGIFAYNINVITGYFVQSDHWSGRVFLITEGITWATLFYYFVVYLKETFKPSCAYAKIAIIVCSISVISLTSNVVYSQITENIRIANSYTVSSNLMDGYRWLNDNTPTGSVVMSSSLETNLDLSVHSHNKLFLARAQSTLASDEELLKRLYITYRLFAISPESLDEMLKSFKGVFYFFAAKYNSRELDAALRPYKYPSYKVPDEVRARIVDEYTHYKISEKIPYRLDYIFIGPREKELGINRESLRHYEVLYEKNGIVIYSYR